MGGYIGGFSFKNFDNARKRWITYALCKMAVGSISLGGVVCLFAIPLGVLFGTAGLMTGVMAGGVHLMPTQLKFGFTRRLTNMPQILKITGLVLKQGIARARTNARARRSISRSAVAFSGGGGDDGDGSSDSSDPDSFCLSFIFISLCYKYINILSSSLNPWNISCYFFRLVIWELEVAI